MTLQVVANQFNISKVLEHQILHQTRPITRQDCSPELALVYLILKTFDAKHEIFKM